MSNISSASIGLNVGTTTARRDAKFPMKNSRVAGAAASAIANARTSSMWYLDGQAGGGGAVAASSAVVPTRATDGAVGQTNPSGGRQKWLVRAEAAFPDRGNLALYDRLVHISGLVGNVNTAQPVTGVAAPAGRYADGVGNSIWLEVSTQIGATPTTVTAVYTDTANASQTTQAIAIGGTSDREIYRIIKLPLASGSTGVKSVQSVTLAASTGTAGNMTLLLAHYLWDCGEGQSRASARSVFTEDPGFVEVMTDACLFWIYRPFTTTVFPGYLHAELQFLEN